jgi:hypothetical protein
MKALFIEAGGGSQMLDILGPPYPHTYYLPIKSRFNVPAMFGGLPTEYGKRLFELGDVATVGTERMAVYYERWVS